MRKNKMMRAAALLLVAVLLTTCTISGTFAKYTASYSGNDSARVAYWGFESANLNLDMFDGSYDGTVNSDSNENVIAPGTTKTWNITLVAKTNSEGESNRAPEVAYKFEIAVECECESESLLGKLNWYLNDSETAMTWSELKNAVAALSSERVEANNWPTNTELSIKWEWPFENESVEGWNDTDTALGNADNLAEIKITLTYGATQIN